MAMVSTQTHSARQKATRGITVRPPADCAAPAELCVISHLVARIIRRSRSGQKGASRYQAEGHHQARCDDSITGPTARRLVSTALPAPAHRGRSHCRAKNARLTSPTACWHASRRDRAMPPFPVSVSRRPHGPYLMADVEGCPGRRGRREGFCRAITQGAEDASYLGRRRSCAARK